VASRLVLEQVAKVYVASRIAYLEGTWPLPCVPNDSTSISVARVHVAVRVESLTALKHAVSLYDSSEQA
ncbi:hypothetical protein, partial [Paraburkholderia hospita]|uniref:hypothetical protein n=1 Tax=Paraburkholderia hospita TaxID=169430 RepID=UPI003F5082D3